MDFAGASDFIREKLRKELDQRLCFHDLAHTFDVHDAVLRFASLEHIPDQTRRLIEIAALYHDSGMTVDYSGHENYSIALVVETLPKFGFKEDEITEICKLIRVTTLPQKAVTLAEKIICDADLDSLGREDFFIQSFKLRLEWDHFDILHCSLFEWLSFELDFMENHNYYTDSARELRNARKLQNITDIKELLLRTKKE
jgi:exopolyphosphatase/pppGpp-phosphohydrolase